MDSVSGVRRSGQVMMQAQQRIHGGGEAVLPGESFIAYPQYYFLGIVPG